MWPFPKKSVMDPRHKELINGNIVDLSKRTQNLKELLRCLETAELLNLYEIAIINKAKSNSEKCFKLYQLILRRDGNAFRTLTKSLLKTGNENLAEFLWRDEDQSELLREDEGEIRRRKQSIENAKIGLMRPDPKPQTKVSIIISVIVLLLAASIPIALTAYIFKAWINQILGR